MKSRKPVKMDTLHIKIPATLKKKVKLRALQEDQTMAEWVTRRLQMGLVASRK